MVLNSEQAKAIKKQLIENIEKSFPADKKDFAKNQIQSMDSEQLEGFLKKNNLKIEKGHLTSSGQGESNCIFCSITSKKVDSYKIAENKEALAVLEINPVSEGHAIVIPKKHISSVEDIPPPAFLLSKEISKKMKEKLKPKEVKVSSSNMFGHEIINIIPVYAQEDENLEERKPADKERLEELQKTLKIREMKAPKKKANSEKMVINSEDIWLPKRIP